MTSDPLRWRKKPVVIEAWQLTQMNAADVAAWCGGDIYNFERLADGEDIWVGLTILTLEGEMLAQPGDWVIKGVQGEFYPCKPDIFAETYEPVEDDHDR